MSSITYQNVNIRIDETGKTNHYKVVLEIPGRRNYPEANFSLDLEELISLAAQPEAYGQYLGQALFDNDVLGIPYRETLASFLSQGQGIHLRLNLEAEALESLAWERLYHPAGQAWEPLAMDAKTPLSRYIVADQWDRPQSITDRPLKALVVMASPQDLNTYNLDPISALERERVRQTFTSLPQIEPTYLESETATLPTLDALRQTLTQGYHLLYIMAHARQTTNTGTVLYLADEDDDVDPVPAQRLVKLFRKLRQAPALVFLAACESAKRSEQTAFLPLGPDLVARGGVPTVVAMTDKVSIVTAQDFTRYFYGQLLLHGWVDVAVNEARAAVEENWDWSVPILFSRLPDNQVLTRLDDLETDTAPPPPPAGPHRQPPPPPVEPPLVETLIGREADLAYFAEKLAQTNLAVISGMPGMGKTVLGAQLARQTVPLERIFWHNFHPGDEISALIWKVAAFLTWHDQTELWDMIESARQYGTELPPVEGQFEYMFSLLAGQDYLICLDDFHHVAEDPMIEKLVDRMRDLVFSGQIKLMIISRQIPSFVQTVDFDPLTGLDEKAAAALFQDQSLTLPESQLQVLYDQTGGNPRFLTLVLNLLERQPNTDRLIDNLVRVDDIERYLLDEIDSSLSERQQFPTWGRFPPIEGRVRRD